MKASERTAAWPPPDEHARHCVMGADGQEQVDETDELMAAVGRLMRRG